MKKILVFGMMSFIPYSFASSCNNSPLHKLTRTISLDTGYAPYLNSNRAIGEFDLELRQAWGALYDWQHDIWQPSSCLGRSILYSLFTLATYAPQLGQAATYHELGHATRLRSIGFRTSFLNIGKAAWNIYVEEKQTLTFEDVLSDEYFPTLGGVVLVSFVWPKAFLFSAVLPRYDQPLLFQPQNIEKHYNTNLFDLHRRLYKARLEKRYDPKKNKDLLLLEEALCANMLTPSASVLIMAGGLNNQQDQCRRVEDHLWYNEGDHFTLVGTYFWDKTWAGFQSASSLKRGYNDGQDTSRICNAYAKLGIDLTHEEIIRYSYLSYVLSSQTYKNIYQIYKTISEGENKVYAPEVWSVRLPNVALYFTTKGPTYNVSSGYRYGETWYFPVSIEFGLKQSTWEATIGIRKKFPSFHNSFIHAEVVFNSEAVGGSMYGGAIFDKLWNVQAGVTYHNSNTLQGERNIPSYKKGDADIEAWLKIGVAY